MSGGTESVRVVIFGEEYTVKGDVDPAVTRSVADYVGCKMNEVRHQIASRDKVKIAVLSAMNIAGELFECRAKSELASRRLREYDERMSTIDKKIQQCI